MATPKTVLICKIGDEYHLTPYKNSGAIEVPEWLFFGYVEERTKIQDIKQEINSYFK